MNTQINKIIVVYFLLQHFHFFYTLHPQPPHFFLSYTPGGSTAPSAPLLPGEMY